MELLPKVGDSPRYLTVTLKMSRNPNDYITPAHVQLANYTHTAIGNINGKQRTFDIHATSYCQQF
jgi:hypothetical protein